MARNVEVLVEDITRDDNGQPTGLYGLKRTISYKSFLYLNSNPDNPRYKLLGEVDPKGGFDSDGLPLKLLAGSPNLDSQHKAEAAQNQKSAAPVADAGQQLPASNPVVTVKETVKPIEKKTTSIKNPIRKQKTETVISA